ncbi:E3 ubiquitin-protein ligase RFWD3-like protein [Leptotrombidium deliense]|uniref:RING-type E3 ubiquitin transferase n=1 Tax=Leptotrombidium deliense TaxID=299467 RepID=A0A443SUU7_9ACAR|nr:E3 ubiquitin-protein ligase RFWD3-like protein [Leptotrombidium deliense]
MVESDIGEYELDSFLTDGSDSIETDWTSSDEDDIQVIIESDDEIPEVMQEEENEQSEHEELAAEMNAAPEINPQDDEGMASTSTTLAYTQAANDSSTQSDDGMTCPICFEQWANSDTHRLVSLKCGHLFGKSCVEKWLREQQTSKRRCPQCNTSAKISDIRNIYAKRLKVVDTRERDLLTEKLETEKELRIKAEQEAQELEMKLAMSMSENERLKEELMNVKRPSHNRINSVAAQNRTSQIMRKVEPFKFVCATEINVSGNCRVLASSDVFGVIVVSQPSMNPLFHGFGIRKVSTEDFKPREFIHLHQSHIKDVTFHPYDSIVITAAQDKTVKITSLITHTVVSITEVESNAWSVCWNQKRPEYFYVGLQTGNINEYDIRRPSVPLKQICSLRQPPVVSLQYLDSTEFEGVIATHLSHCDFLSCVNGEYEVNRIPMKGSFTSSHVEKKTGNILLSSRPSKDLPQMTHSILSLTKVGQRVRPQVVRQFKAGNQAVHLSRSRMFPNPSDEDSSLICAGDEASNGTLIWDLKTSSIMQTLNSSSPVFDLSIMNLRNNDATILSTLTEKSLSVYKWNY